MNRIDRIFHDLRRTGGKALMPFLTAGDPDLATTGAMLPAIQRAGAAVCELGIAFSDPIADGPVIQASMTHALSRGVRPGQVLEMVAGLRSTLAMGLVAMVSYSIVYRLGHRGHRGGGAGGGNGRGAAATRGDVKSFLTDAKQAGIDGFIVPDLPVEEAQPVVGAMGELDLSCSFLIAPTTPDDRARRIAQACSGFVYVLSRAGLTGERSELPAELPQRIRRLREATDLPIAVGFGIANAEQVRQVAAVADAAIVGSAIMRRVASLRDRSRDDVVREVASFVGELAGGLAARSAV